MHLIVNGGVPLSGRIESSANKNAVLPVLCATLLSGHPITLHRVPDITDVRKLLSFFESLGSVVRADFATGTVELDHARLQYTGKESLPKGMRSAVMLVPPLLRRFGLAAMDRETKGCTLGVREIDPHLEVFQAFGRTAAADSSDRLVIRGPQQVAAVDLWPEYASVTATENFVMSAVLADGTSRLTNAAAEPHVQEFCRFLNGIGARISGIGTSALTIEGVRSLSGGEFTFGDDFHEVVTFLALGAVTGGAVTVRNRSPQYFGLFDRVFRKFGIMVQHSHGWSHALAPSGLSIRKPFTANYMPKVEAAPWPYLPADLLPIFIALGVCAKGQMLFWNKVYDGGLGWMSETAKFGAHAVMCDPHRVLTAGVDRLTGATVESPYIIRAAIALLMIAAHASGTSCIMNADPIRRAHPNFVENLRAIGADVRWAEDTPAAKDEVRSAARSARAPLRAAWDVGVASMSMAPSEAGVAQVTCCHEN